MIVSWNWLKQYVLLDMPVEELQRRLMMAGLNHEATAEVGGDLAIDLEVTSNRPDCLGHLGIAREIAVLWQRELKLPPACPAEGRAPVQQLVQVRIDCPELCSRYTARVIRGVKIGPSPAWLVRRLATLGLPAINNVVDITNYVLMECGQPLHAFDYARLLGPEIIVRQPLPGEVIEAIDHKVYRLEPGMCVIADAERPVAIGGVMGGAATEVSETATDVLIEAAEFDPISIRSTARRLNLHSDSSYRFERRIDPEGIDWASRRCCELVLELAGGELARGVVDVGAPPPKRVPVVLRLAQLKRILGIEVPAERVRQILLALGNEEVLEAATTTQPSPEAPSPLASYPAPLGSASRITVIPPSWRRDLTREIDLVEEVGRVFGYDAIPEDVGVPMVPSARTREDRVLEKVRHVLTAAGFDEAMTLSVVDQQSSEALSPWTGAEPLCSLMPVIRGADRLRRSLVPSLLGARRTNEALSNPEIELFEIAKVYLPQANALPDEERMLSIASGRGYAAVRGVIEAVVAALDPAVELAADTADLPLLDPGHSCRLILHGAALGFVGQLLPEGLSAFDLRSNTTVAEVKLSLLVRAASLVPTYVPLPPYPAVSRDINLVVAESTRWAEVAEAVHASAGPRLENLEYRDTYRDPPRLGSGKKSLLFTINLRWKEGTLTSQQADEIRDRVVAACHARFGAELRA